MVVQSEREAELLLDAAAVIVRACSLTNDLQSSRGDRNGKLVALKAQLQRCFQIAQREIAKRATMTLYFTLAIAVRVGPTMMVIGRIVKDEEIVERIRDSVSCHTCTELSQSRKRCSSDSTLAAHVAQVLSPASRLCM